MRLNAEVERIESCADDSDPGNLMFISTLGVREGLAGPFHGAAITVIGANLTECIERTYTVLNAFNKKGDK